MQCQTEEGIYGGNMDLQNPAVSFMDFSRTFQRNSSVSGPYETPAVSAGCVITANPLCYLSGHFMDIKSPWATRGAGMTPPGFPGAVYPATNLYRAPFADLPFPAAPAPLSGYPPVSLAMNSTVEQNASSGLPRNHIHCEDSVMNAKGTGKDGLRGATDESQGLPPRRQRSAEGSLPERPTVPSPPASPSPPPPSHKESSSSEKDSDSPRRNSDSPTEARSISPSAKKYPDYCRTLVVKDANGATKELVFPKALDLDRPKRARTTFSAEQLYRLEREFNRNQYLVGRERTDLAQQLQLSETQVKVWFQNRRTKYKRDQQREAEERHANADSIAACNLLRILQPQHPPGGATGAPVTSSASKEESHFRHNPFLPPSLSQTPPAGHLLSLPRPPYFGGH